jgi:hypothetical protein
VESPSDDERRPRRATPSRFFDAVRGLGVAGSDLSISIAADIGSRRTRPKSATVISVNTPLCWTRQDVLADKRRVGGETSDPSAAQPAVHFPRRSNIDRISPTYSASRPVNELGDIQTEAPVHGGLTVFGRAVVREMNRLGIVVDVAHATHAVVAGVVETTTQPIILSHSNIQDAGGWARFISPEHARLVAKAGGVIGAMPIIFGRRGDDIGGYGTTSRDSWTRSASTTSVWARTWTASVPAPSSPATRGGHPWPRPCSTTATGARTWRRSSAATPSACSERSKRRRDHPEFR